MAFSRTKFVNLLRAQAGYHEGRDPSGNWNNMQKFSPATLGLEWSQGQAWCATFTAWGADELGARERWPITASCYTAVQWWKKAGRWTEYPVLGGPFYLGTVGQDHVGVVYAYDADTIWTVEGNTNASGSAQGDGVYLRSRPRRGPGSPYGYGVPEFDEGTVSADPELGGTAKASVPAPAPKPPAAKPQFEPFPGAAFFKANPRSPIVTAMGKRLVAEGCSRYRSGPGPQWTEADRQSYAAWQRKLGFSGADADGWPGKTSWDRLRVPNV